MSDLNNELSNKKQRLGRGLGSLLGAAQSEITKQRPEAEVQNKSQTTVAAVIPPESRIWNISIDKLVPSQFQPRTHFEKEKLEELATSIKQNGILQPIVARKLNNGSFEIIAGERRWRAAQMAGKHEVPVILKTLSNKETLELAIIENIQREDLNPIEEAEALQRLMSEFGLTQQQVSERVGKERTTITNTIRLLSLPRDVKEMIGKKELSHGHAKVLLGLSDEKAMLKLAKKAVTQNLSVRKLEQEVQNFKASSKEKGEISEDAKIMSRIISGLSDDLQKNLGTRVSIDYKNGKGKVLIQFYSDDELTAIVEKVKLGCKK